MIKYFYLFWKSHENCIITKEWHLNCAEHGLQIRLTPTEARRVLTLDIQPTRDE